MTTFFDYVKKHRHELSVRWVSQTFLMANTARMLRDVKANDIREQLRKSMGDCSRLADCDGQESYDRVWNRYVHGLQTAAGGEERLPFGQAAKLVNLYVKTAIGQRDLLPPRQARKILERAHVPIDSLVLKKLWREFPEAMKQVGARRYTALRRIKSGEYEGMQKLLRSEAQRAHCVPLDFDFAYVDRRPRARKRGATQRKAARSPLRHLALG